ncbi:MAG: adenylate/guanylate cyclase domain-containing protein [Mycobacterium sp.]
MTTQQAPAGGGRGMRGREAVRMGVAYAARLALAHVVSAIATALIVVSLSRNTAGDARALLTEQNLVTLIVLIAVSAVAGAAADVINVYPSLRWFADGETPTRAQTRAAIRIPARQTAVHLAVWIVSGAVFALVNLRLGPAVAAVIGLVILFGAGTTASICHLLTQRTLRPVIASAMRTTPSGDPAPGVLARLMIVWTLFSALPMLGVGLIVLARSNGWFVAKTAPVERPVLVLAAVSLALGIRAMALTAQSISDPVGEIVVAMAQVEHGATETAVDVYESSEIGRLQVGFNSMVRGLAERERLRELFGRHVGVDVARRAIAQDALHSGDVRSVGILFVDLLGSTQLAAAGRPQDVARILNAFFRIVVAAVDDHQGLVNKFEGDAALAVFGAPLDVADPASAALATARDLAVALKALPDIDFGVGVSAGSVFAGNIGAENRYEYTVIGDPVNEAARLADYAKELPSRVVCSERAIAAASVGEQGRWTDGGKASLRGRPHPTVILVPAVS